MSEWQPIETAPKDGSEVLAYFPELGCVVACYYETDRINNAGGWAIGRDYYGAPPTHWMQLPAPPKGKA